MVTSRRVLVAVSIPLILAWAAQGLTGRVQPPPVEALRAAAYVGAQACAPCHQPIHATWTGGRHSKMLQPATAASVKGNFSNDSVLLHGDRYRLRAANGEYFITESHLTGKPQEHHVEYTLGSRRIQHYLTTIEKGRIIVLPPSWDVQRQEWFHNMDIVRPDEDGQTRIQQWNRNCVGCHVSQQENNYRPASRDYATRWMDFGTSCERCHGPGSSHVEQYARGASNRRPAGERLIVQPKRLDPATSSMICAQCHSLRNVVSPDYKAGQNYYDHFMPVLEYEAKATADLTYWADGRPRRFSNDAIGLWQSQCFLRGGATCTSCHQDPHEPDVDKNAQLASGNNALCTRCHKEIGARLTAHTRHQAASAGSSCVECHMPRTVVSIKATMRDHTIGVPAPENTVAYGIPNACTECHANKKAAWAVDVLAKWWPDGRRTKLMERAAAFTAARAKRPEAVDRLIAIASDDKMGPLIQANAVGYLRDYPSPSAEAALLAAATATHAAIRGVAISGFGQRPAPGTAVRSALLSALDDRERAVRIAALVSLINVGRGELNPTDEARFRRVGEEFAARARAFQDDAGIQRDLGFVHLLTGDVDRAADALEISLGLEANRPSTSFLFALARIGQRRLDEARALLGQVRPSDPYYGEARERLKKLESAR
jgi:predicted CXXCH cytochrome family protein